MASSYCPDARVNPAIVSFALPSVSACVKYTHYFVVISKALVFMDGLLKTPPKMIPLTLHDSAAELQISNLRSLHVLPAEECESGPDGDEGLPML